MPHLMASSASSSSPTWTTISWHQGMGYSRAHLMGMSSEPIANNTLVLRVKVWLACCRQAEPSFPQLQYSRGIIDPKKMPPQGGALLSPGSEPPQETRLAAPHASCEVIDRGVHLGIAIPVLDHSPR